MIRFSRGATCIFAWLLLAGAGSRAFGQQYPFLPVGGSPKSVQSLFQDSHGRLWLGGLEPACFDGTRFFELHDYGFPPAEAYDFSEDAGGAIWIAAETGAYRFANGRVEEVAKGVAVSVIAATPDVAVAAMGPLGRSTFGNASLFRIQRTGDRWRTETVMSLDSPGPLTLDPSRMLLYPVPGKGWNEMRLDDVVRWRPGGQVPVIRHPLAHFPDNPPIKVMRDYSGCVWGNSADTSYECGGVGHMVPLPGATKPNMHEGLDGAMVLHGNNVLAFGRPGAFRVAARANGLPGLLDAIPGRDGTVWLGTPEGLCRFPAPFRVESWTIRDGIADIPWSIARSGGRVYAGLSGGRIAALSENRLRWNIVNIVTAFKESGFVSGLLGAKDGSLFASLSGAGAVQLSTKGGVVAQTEEGHSNGDMRLARTPDGETWVGDGGIGRLTRKGRILKFEAHPLQTKPSGNVLGFKYEEHTQKLWACYNGGLVVRDEQGDWKEFTTRDGLLINGCWSLAPLPNGDVWYAYRGLNAIARIRPTADGRITVRQYGSNEGIPGPGNDTMDADQRGWSWRSGGLGIYVADAAEAEAGKWLQLDQSDGFPANDMNSGSVFVDNDGSLWWGADNDLAHYTPPADLVTPQFAPQAFVSAFSWEGQAARLAEAVSKLPHGSKITAHIGSLQFDRRSALRVRYRLLPEQTSWRESRSLDLALGMLSSGAHTLEVQGRIFTGPWSGTERRSFTVLRPAGLAWRLLAAYFMAATGLATGGYLLRRRHLAEEAALLPDLAAWRMGALLPEVHELEGTLLDARFEVGGLLARGGFASVLDGYDRQQQQRCAIKVFRGEVKDKAWIQRSFEQEVAALK